MSIVKIEMPYLAPKVVKAADEQMRLARSTAEVLRSAFYFDASAEGQRFWNSVVYRLRQISQDGILDE